jgi:hypothetical protein
VFARVRTLQDLHKRLTADLSKAEDAQQQEKQQQEKQQQEKQQQEKKQQEKQQQEKQQAAEPMTTPEAPEAPKGLDLSCGGEQGVLLPTSACRTPAQSVSTCGGDSAADAACRSHGVYVQRLTQLLAVTGPCVAELQQQLDHAVTKFKWTAEYYCEDVERHTWKQQPVAFLTHFLDLLDGLVATQKDSARVARVTAMLSQYVELQQQQQQQQQAPDGQQDFDTAGANQAGEVEPRDDDDVDTEQLDDIYFTDQAIMDSSSSSSPTAHSRARHNDMQQQQQDMSVKDATGAADGTARTDAGTAASGVSSGDLAGGDGANAADASMQLLDVQMLPLQQLPAKPQVPLLALAKAQRHLEPTKSAAGKSSCRGLHDGAAAPAALPSTATRSPVRCEGIGCSRARKAASAGVSSTSSSSSPTSSCPAGVSSAGSARCKKADAGKAAPPPATAATVSHHKLTAGHSPAASGTPRSSSLSTTVTPAAQQLASGGCSKALKTPRAAGAVKAVRPHQQQQQAAKPLVRSGGASSGQRARSLSPRPLPSGRPAPGFLSPSQPSMHQQQRLDALRLRSKHSPRPQLPHLEHADELPLPSSPAGAVLMDLESVAKPASAQPSLFDVGNVQQGAEQGALYAAVPEIPDTLPRLLFDSIDSIDFEQ